MTSAAQKARAKAEAQQAAAAATKKAEAAANKPAAKAHAPAVSKPRVQIATDTPDGAQQEHTLAANTKMVDVTVPKAFRLTLDDGVVVQYDYGTKQMPADHANHWWSKAMGVTTD